MTARDRGANSDGDDEVLSRLDESDFDELWLFAVDAGDGLTGADCRGITRFRRRGGGLLTTRDHHDVGSSLCTLGGVGHAHFFHSRHRDPDEARRERDDQAAGTISWPNYQFELTWGGLSAGLIYAGWWESIRIGGSAYLPEGGPQRDALQRLFSSAKVLRVPFAKRRPRTAKRRTSPVPEVMRRGRRSLSPRCSVSLPDEMHSKNFPTSN